MRPGPKPRSIVDRFWQYAKKSDTDQCWQWEGPTTTAGYGSLELSLDENGDRRVVTAHRLSYEIAFGPIPDGLEVCHHCDNPPCTNPDHLFLGTHSDNMQDMSRKGRHVGMRGQRKTHCKRGHEYTPENTYTYPNGDRYCRACLLHHSRITNAKRRKGNKDVCASA